MRRSRAAAIRRPAAGSAPRARRRSRGALSSTPSPTGAVDVDQRVGHVAARLVDHVVDVEPGLRHRGRDLAEHVGHVGIRDRDAEGRLARHRHRREVDRVDDVAVLEVVAQLVDHHHRAVVLGLARRGAEVRQRDHRGVAEQSPRSGSRRRTRRGRSALERRQHAAASSTTPSREKFSSTAPGRIRPMLRGVDQVPRRVDQRHVQRDEVRVLQHLATLPALLHLRRQAPGGVDGDLGVVAEHVHAELDRRVGDQAADLAEADDAQRVPGQLEAGEGLLAFLDRRARCPARPGRARRRSAAPGRCCAPPSACRRAPAP